MGAFYFCTIINTSLTLVKNGFDLALSVLWLHASCNSAYAYMVSVTIFISYASLRFYGIREDSMFLIYEFICLFTHSLMISDTWAKSSGIDCLALAACLIFPRYILLLIIRAFLTIRFPDLPLLRWRITWWIFIIYEVWYIDTYTRSCRWSFL